MDPVKPNILILCLCFLSCWPLTVSKMSLFIVITLETLLDISICLRRILSYTDKRWIWWFLVLHLSCLPFLIKFSVKNFNLRYIFWCLNIVSFLSKLYTVHFIKKSLKSLLPKFILTNPKITSLLKNEVALMISILDPESSLLPEDIRYNWESSTKIYSLSLCVQCTQQIWQVLPKNKLKFALS